MSRNHLVSVIIPSYNRADYIIETIESVIHQTWTQWELIIVDDGSTDNTREVLSPYLNNKIKFYEVEHIGQVGKIRNIGITKSTGDFIAFHDSDDLWRADKLEYQMDLFDKFPNAVFAISNGDEFGENYIQTPDYTPALFNGDLFKPIFERAEFCMYVPTFIFKRVVIDTIGMLPVAHSTMNDIQFFFMMSYRFEGIFSNERLVNIRKHKRNTSSKSDVIAYINSLLMLKDFLALKMINKREYQYQRGLCYYKMGLVYLRKKDPLNSVKNFLRYNMVYPIQYKGYARLLQACFLLAKHYFSEYPSSTLH